MLRSSKSDIPFRSYDQQPSEEGGKCSLLESNETCQKCSQAQQNPRTPGEIAEFITFRTETEPQYIFSHQIDCFGHDYICKFSTHLSLSQFIIQVHTKLNKILQFPSRSLPNFPNLSSTPSAAISHLTVQIDGRTVRQIFNRQTRLQQIKLIKTVREIK